MRKYLQNVQTMDWFKMRKLDKRNIKWFVQRVKYGFDERDTWDFSAWFFPSLYERLKMFQDVTNIDYSCCHESMVTYNKILKLTEDVKIYLETLDSKTLEEEEQHIALGRRIIKDYSDIYEHLWW